MNLLELLKSTSEVSPNLKKRGLGLLTELDSADLPLRVSPRTLFDTQTGIGTISLAASCYSKDGKKEHNFHLKLAFKKADRLKNFKVRDAQCSCEDYIYRWQRANHAEGVCEEAPQELPTDGKPVNPDNIPGMCKHLAALVIAAQNKGLLPKASQG